MAQAPVVIQARDAFIRRRWREAYAHFSTADSEALLEPADLERLATAAYLVGDDARAIAVWTRAHHQFIDRGDFERAARIGFWLSLCFLLGGGMARSSGWLARSQRLLEDREEACGARGYGLIVSGLMAMGKGDAENASENFEQALALAERFADPDLLALGLLGRGQSLIQSRRIVEGVTRFDEAMVAITAGEVSPLLAGIIYCAVILTCQRIFDLSRAREWTTQLDAWCASQPDLAPYRGQCLVHRSEILQWQGDWSGALAEVMKARDHLVDRSEAVVGRACYQQGELHRLRGQFAEARRLYDEAARLGCEPQPGVSLLRMAEGKPDVAAAAIRAIAESAGGPGGRPGLLQAAVDIFIAAGDLDAARAAADALTRIATEFDALSLQATSAQARGALLFAEGDLTAALALLREACAIWLQLEAPYECARVRVLIGQVCQRLGDRDGARMHFDAARSVFARLGAAPDLTELERLTTRRDGNPFDVLTGRERDVLSLVAAGETNRRIGAAMGISEHTVARHLSNIFDKLGVTSRTAASTLAHKYKLD